MHLHDNLNDATRFGTYTEAVLAASYRAGFTFKVHPIRPLGKPTCYAAQFSDGKYA